MKKYARIIAAVSIGALTGLALAACDGRVSGVWCALETAAMILLTAEYFLASGDSGNSIESTLACIITSFLPPLLWTLIVSSKEYFGYSRTHIICGSTVCGMIMLVFGLLSRHQTGPLRAAFGRNMLPAFFGVAGVHRLITYFKDMGSFTISFKDELCVHGLLFVLFALGVFIGANRSKLAKLDAYIALAVWIGVFTVLHLIEAVNIPVLEV